MNNLEAIRRELDKVNQEIASQLEKRFQILEKMGREKKSQKLPLLDPERVKKMIQNISEQLADSKNKDYIIPVFKKIFDESLRCLEENEKKNSNN